MKIQSKINFFLSIWLRENISFIIMIFGSISYFVSSVLLRNYLNSEDYGIYSLIITFISLSSSFGLLGFEQSLIRFSDVKNDLILDKRSLIYAIVAGIFFSVFSSLIMIFYFKVEINIVLSILLLLFTSICILIFNILRLNRFFILAQLLLNGWRISLFLYIVFIIIIGFSFNIPNIFLSITIIQASLIGYFIYYNFKFLKIETYSLTENSKVLKMSFSFFVSLFSLSFLTYFDRIFVQGKFGANELGDYFYLVNFFLFPFSMIQTYIGFKEIVMFKKLFNYKILHSKIVRTFIFGLVMAMVLLFLGYLTDQFEWSGKVDIKNNSLLIILLLLIGIVKLVYALVSSALGAIGTIDMIKSSNYYFNLVLIIGVVFLYFYGVRSIALLVFCFLIFWFSRTSIWFYQLYKLKVNDSSKI